MNKDKTIDDTVNRGILGRVKNFVAGGAVAYTLVTALGGIASTGYGCERDSTDVKQTQRTDVQSSLTPPPEDHGDYVILRATDVSLIHLPEGHGNYVFISACPIGTREYVPGRGLQPDVDFIDKWVAVITTNANEGYNVTLKGLNQHEVEKIIEDLKKTEEGKGAIENFYSWPARIYLPNTKC